MNSRRVALVTGGSRGIGRAVCERLAADGIIVHLVFHQQAASAHEVCDAIRAQGGEASIHQADVGSEDQARGLVEAVLATHDRLDILVNNAGMADDRLLISTPTESWDTTLRVNLSSAFWLMREVVSVMLDRSWGRIVNISSSSAQRPGPGQCAYAAAKGGLEALTRAVAAEVGHKGIRVNAVAPGAIDTDMTRALREKTAMDPQRPWGTPADVAEVVAFLVSDAASYIQGQVLAADGGRSTARPRGAL